MSKVRFIAAAVLLAALPAIGNAASFNCAQARTPIENAICYNRTLDRLDTEMGRLYHEARYTIPGIKTQQRHWIEHRNRRCGANESCLIRLTRQRNDVLRRQIDSYRGGGYKYRPAKRPTVFFPQRGIVCDRKGKFCADSYGISIGFTKEYLGSKAAKRLRKNINRYNMDTKAYTLSNGIYCNSRRYRCYQNRYSGAPVNGYYTNRLFR